MKKKQPLPPPRPGITKVFSRRRLAAALFFAALLVFAQASFIIPLKEKNGRLAVTSHLAVEEDFFLPALQALRSREKLDQVTAPGRTQFDKIVLLRDWTRRQWEPGSKFYYPPWDAMEILDLARKAKNFGFCAQYGVVFLQACLSMGIHARYLDIDDHFVTEAWSDDYGKWVIMDPYLDVHYERNGVPLNARELCEAYWKTGTRGLVKVCAGGARTPLEKSDIRRYRMYALYLRNNHLSNPVSMSRGGKTESLSHKPDYHEYPRIGAGPSSVVYVHTIVAFRNNFAKEYFTTWPVITDSETYDRPVNQTVISIRGSADRSNAVKVALLADQSPAFSTFLIRFNDGDWQKAPDRMMGELTPGLNRFSARIATKFGWLGPESSMVLFYKPPWLFKW